MMNEKIQGFGQLQATRLTLEVAMIMNGVLRWGDLPLGEDGKTEPTTIF